MVVLSELTLGILPTTYHEQFAINVTSKDNTDFRLKAAEELVTMLHTYLLPVKSTLSKLTFKFQPTYHSQAVAVVICNDAVVFCALAVVMLLAVVVVVACSPLHGT